MLQVPLIEVYDVPLLVENQKGILKLVQHHCQVVWMSKRFHLRCARPCCNMTESRSGDGLEAIK